MNQKTKDYTITKIDILGHHLPIQAPLQEIDILNSAVNLLNESLNNLTQQNNSMNFEKLLILSSLNIIRDFILKEKKQKLTSNTVSLEKWQSLQKKFEDLSVEKKTLDVELASTLVQLENSEKQTQEFLKTNELNNNKFIELVQTNQILQNENTTMQEQLDDVIKKIQEYEKIEQNQQILISDLQKEINELKFQKIELTHLIEDLQFQLKNTKELTSHFNTNNWELNYQEENSKIKKMIERCRSVLK